MADEARVLSGLVLNIGNIKYNSQPNTFNTEVVTAKGPSPGAITVATGGTSVDLSALTTPALCRIQNQDSTNYVTVGVYSGAVFYPMLELLPSESYVIRLARSIGTLRIVANTAACECLVEAFSA